MELKERKKVRRKNSQTLEIVEQLKDGHEIFSAQKFRWQENVVKESESSFIEDFPRRKSKHRDRLLCTL
jgi:hypothetical protein